MTEDNSIDPSASGSDSIDFMSPALAYARNGWRVLPVFEGEKRPRLKDWVREATTDFDTVRHWWVDWPTSNVGVATGRGSGFWVLDIDPKHGGDDALEALQLEHGGLPRTYTVRTPSGGTHYYFLCPADLEVTNSAGEV